MRAGDGVKHSPVHWFWMASCFQAVVAWWIGFWDLRDVTRWPVIVVLCFLAGVVALFLAVALLCPKIPPAGRIDLRQVHLKNCRKYLAPTLIAMLVAVAVSLYYGNVQNVPNQNLQAAIFT